VPVVATIMKRNGIRKLIQKQDGFIDCLYTVFANNCGFTDSSNSTTTAELLMLTSIASMYCFKVLLQGIVYLSRGGKEPPTRR